MVARRVPALLATLLLITGLVHAAEIKIDSATFEYKKSMHHGQVGQYVSIQDCFRPGHQCFSHGIDADILVDGDFQLSGQRGNDCDFLILICSASPAQTQASEN